MSEPNVARVRAVTGYLGEDAPDASLVGASSLDAGVDVPSDPSNLREPAPVVVYDVAAARRGFGARVAWGPLRIGLGVGRGRLRAVVLRGGTIVRAAELVQSDGLALDAGLALLLGALPRASRRHRVARRQTVAVAVGGPYAQVKHLVGVPPVADERELARMLTINAGRFFRKNGVPLVVTGTYVDAPGRAWAAVVEAPVLTALDRACRRAALRLTFVVPTLAVLAAATPAREVAWADDGAFVRLGFGASDELLGAHRTFTPASDGAVTAPPPPVLEPELEVLGDRGWEYADAYGAALASDASVLRLRWSRARRRSVYGLAGAVGSSPGGSGDHDAERAQGRHGSAGRRWAIARLAAAGVAFGGAAFAAVTAPSLVSWYVGRVARADLRAFERARLPFHAGTPDATSRRATARALELLSDFDARRQSVARVLAAVTASLPSRATLVSFACDSAGGTVVVIAPRAARVVAGLEGVPGLADAAVVGAITRETPSAPPRSVAFGAAPYATPSYGPAYTPYTGPTAGPPVTPPSRTGGAPGSSGAAPPGIIPAGGGRLAAPSGEAAAVVAREEVMERATIRFRFDRTIETMLVFPRLPGERGAVSRTSGTP